MTEHEEKLLLVLAGKAEHRWGSWMGEAMSFLRGRGFAEVKKTSWGVQWAITDAGRAYLKERGL